jgi:hypothetical protein
MKQRLRRIVRGGLVVTVLLFVLLFVGVGIGWLIAHISRDLNSSPVLEGEFVHPWNNHGAIVYMTGRQKYWVETFDKVSSWCFVAFVIAFACWIAFVALRKQRD